MARSASWGWGKGIDGREAARLAAQQALSRLGAGRPAFGVVFVSHEFELSPVLNGLGSVLGDTPLWGISTFRPIISAGEQARSVVVGLLAGADLSAKVSLWPRFAQNSAETAGQVLQALRAETGELDGVLLASDGSPWLAAWPPGIFSAAKLSRWGANRLAQAAFLSPPWAD